MKTRSRSLPTMPALAAIAVLLTPAIAGAQAQVFAYPAAGQSAEQQARDKYECHTWAVSQVGFDPTNAQPLPPANMPPPAYGYSDQPPPPPPQQQKSSGFLGLGSGGALQGTGMVGDAATGAALGAAGGAIAGNAGQGAAIGAIASTLFGAYKRSTTDSSPQPQQQQYAQQQYQQQQYQQQQYQAQQANQAYTERLNKTSDYNQAFGACMKSRKYTIN